ncbi:MAG: hypothetical protein E7466_00015 [Ruminococcaceae bacterium]|nr:hypothetical protein [Oscillospiraceae bacterium]
MEQNYTYNPQENPAPHGNQYPQQPPAYNGQYGYYPQPMGYPQTMQPAPMNHPEVDAVVDSAFGKCLAATIMCSFPITSIISIVLGSSGLKQVDQANQMAAYYGATAGGKCVAAKVLGKIGKIAGIAMTCFWGLYFLLVIGIIASFM